MSGHPDANASGENSYAVPDTGSSRHFIPLRDECWNHIAAHRTDLDRHVRARSRLRSERKEDFDPEKLVCLDRTAAHSNGTFLQRVFCFTHLPALRMRNDKKPSQRPDASGEALAVRRHLWVVTRYTRKAVFMVRSSREFMLASGSTRILFVFSFTTCSYVRDKGKKEFDGRIFWDRYEMGKKDGRLSSRGY